jgi:excisionase family DNA binding protein
MGSNEEPVPAGSARDHLSIIEAASFLGKCSKTVRGYIQNGVLRARRFKGQGRTLWIRKDDLQAFKEMAEQRLRTVDIWDLLKTIKLRLHSIEHKLDFLMRVNGLDVSALRDAKTEVLLSAYDEVCEFLQVDSFNISWDQMQEWAKIFLQFTELEYERLVGPTMDAQPWKPFQLLCRHLMESLRRKKGFGSHPQMQQTYRLLDKARRHIAQSALVFEEFRSDHLGARRVAELVGFGVEEDSLDRYIAAEAFRSRLH